MRTKRIHNISLLKEEIKQRAAESRDLRNQARATTGMDRHALKQAARSYGEDTRPLLLAYGYLRGKTIEQMESASTHPLRLADCGAILSAARPFFQKGPEAEPWTEEVQGETKIVTPVPDNRGFIGKMLGRPAPEPKVSVRKWVDYNDPPGWDEFAHLIETDITAWNQKCELNHLQKIALRRQKAKAAPVEQDAKAAG